MVISGRHPEDSRLCRCVQCSPLARNARSGLTSDRNFSVYFHQSFCLRGVWHKAKRHAWARMSVSDPFPANGRKVRDLGSEVCLGGDPLPSVLSFWAPAGNVSAWPKENNPEDPWRKVPMRLSEAAAPPTARFNLNWTWALRRPSGILSPAA